MPKWRKLHVKVRESLDVNEMPDDFTRLLWVLLPIALDREGRGQDSPAWVRSNVFPLRLDVTLEQIQQAMDWIATHEMLERYQVGGRSYFWVPSFARYQGDRTREAESLYPAPCEQGETYSRPTHDLLTTKSSPDVDVDVDIDIDSDVEVEVDASPPAAAAPLPPESRPEPNADSATAHLFDLIAKAGILIGGQHQAEQWTAIADLTTDLDLLTETFVEAAQLGKRPSPRWVEAMLRRCIEQGTRPGKWNGRARASPSNSHAEDDFDWQAYSDELAQAREDNDGPRDDSDDQGESPT